MIGNSINSPPNNDSLIKNQLFHPSLKFGGPINQHIEIHQDYNKRKSTKPGTNIYKNDPYFYKDSFEKQQSEKQKNNPIEKSSKTNAFNNLINSSFDKKKNNINAGNSIYSKTISRNNNDQILFFNSTSVINENNNNTLGHKTEKKITSYFNFLSSNVKNKDKDENKKESSNNNTSQTELNKNNKKEKISIKDENATKKDDNENKEESHTADNPFLFPINNTTEDDKVKQNVKANDAKCGNELINNSNDKMENPFQDIINKYNSSISNNSKSINPNKIINPFSSSKTNPFSILNTDNKNSNNNSTNNQSINPFQQNSNSNDKMFNPFLQNNNNQINNNNNNPFSKNTNNNNVFNPFSQNTNNNPFTKNTNNNNIVNPFSQNTNNNPFAQSNSKNKMANPFTQSNSKNKVANPFLQSNSKNKVANPFLQNANNSQLVNPFLQNTNQVNNPFVNNINPFLQNNNNQLNNINNNNNNNSNNSKKAVNPFCSITNNANNCYNPFLNNNNIIFPANNDKEEEEENKNDDNDNVNVEEEVKIEKDEKRLSEFKEVKYEKNNKFFEVDVENMQYLDKVDGTHKFVTVGGGMLSFQEEKDRDGKKRGLIVLRDKNTKNVKLQGIIYNNSSVVEKVKLKKGKEIILMKNILATFQKVDKNYTNQVTQLSHFRIRVDNSSLENLLNQAKDFFELMKKNL
jgi:hypothetical protein